MTQILANAGAVTLTKTWYVDGTGTDVDDVTIGVVDGNGDEIVASGTATTNGGSGVYTYALADQPNPDLLTVTWTDVSSGDTRVDRIELVGAWLFTEAQARAFSAKADAAAANIPLASDTEYPDATLADERARITDDLENWTGRSWIPRYCRMKLQGTGGAHLDLRNGIPVDSTGNPLHRPGRLDSIGTLLSVDVGGTAVTVGDIEVDPSRNRLLHKTGTFAASTVSNPFNVTVEYVYGLPILSTA